MTAVYLDTNIYLYLADTNSPYNISCKDFIQFCKEKRLMIATCTETFQEIVYYAQNIGQLKKGLRTSKEAMQISDEILAVSKRIVEKYLVLVEKYPKLPSRDVLHLAASLENRIELIVTYDKDFKKFSEVSAKKPEEIF